MIIDEGAVSYGTFPASVLKQYCSAKVCLVLKKCAVVDEDWRGSLVADGSSHSHISLVVGECALVNMYL